MEMATRLAKLGESVTGLEQYSIKKFGESLECVARTLAVNAGLKDSEVISRLYAAHTAGNVNAGVNIEAESAENSVVDMKEAGVLDHLDTKINAFRLAIEVACTVLRVDSIIMAKAAGGPKKR